MPDRLEQSLQRTLGKGFRVGRELGGGGMSRVFVVEDLGLRRETVVKILHPDMPGATNVERFRREIHLAATLSHPHIVPLLSAGETEGLPYFSMPFVEGESLRAKLQREGELPIADATRVLRDVALALVHAHSKGIVHRDIKPENILLTGGSAVVTDFGVAKALDHASPTSDHSTSAGFALGTPAYMAPEQATADPHVDHRADIYAFGILAYELLTGEVPFRGSAQQVLAAQSTQEPESLDRRRRAIPLVLSNLVTRCLAKRPADRPQSASELVTMLDTVSSTSGEASPYRPRGSARRKRILIGIPVALAIAAGLWVVIKNDVVTQADAPKSVAVLPFVNIGGGQNDDYFSDGITDELTSALGRIDGLRVASRGSAFSFKGKRDLDPRAIGKALNVGTVLEGTVRRSGDRLRVSAQLTSTADGLTLWSDSYERRAADVFDVQEDIAKSIVSALQIELGSRQSLVTGPRNTEAHDLYLRGRFAWNRRSATELANAVRYFEQAIQKDSTYARAYSGLAEAHVLLPGYDPRLSSSESWEKTKAAALRALQLDSSLVEAQAALAYGYGSLDRNPEAAERAFRRAIQMDPEYATAHQWYGDFLASRGQLERSLAEIRIAKSLDPLSLIINSEVGRGLYLLRRYDEAVREAEEGIKLDPTFFLFHLTKGISLSMIGSHARAVEALQLARTLSGRSALPISYAAVALTAAGRDREASALLTELEERTRKGERVSFSLAIAYIAVGRRSDALTALEIAVETREGAMMDITFDPLLDAVRSDPRFVALWRTMGLPPSSPDWK